MNQIFDTIGGIMASIINMVIGILPFTAEQKESYKANISASKFLVGLISVIAMVVGCVVLPMLGIGKMFKKKTRKRRKTRRRRRK